MWVFEATADVYGLLMHAESFRSAYSPDLSPACLQGSQGHEERVTTIRAFQRQTPLDPLFSHTGSQRPRTVTNTTRGFPAVNNNDNIHKTGTVCRHGLECRAKRKRIRQTDAGGQDVRHEWDMHCDIDADLYGKRSDKETRTTVRVRERERGRERRKRSTPLT